MQFSHTTDPAASPIIAAFKITRQVMLQTLYTYPFINSSRAVSIVQHACSRRKSQTEIFIMRTLPVLFVLACSALVRAGEPAPQQIKGKLDAVTAKACDLIRRRCLIGLAV